MPIVSIADAQIHYERAGTGRPLVLVREGGTGAPPEVPYAAADVTSGHTLITPHLSPTTESLAEDQLIAVIEDMGEGRVELLGIAKGSPVAESVASRRPDLVSRLILMTA
ncbi:alpha/beta fold hydrolase [Streptomyces sp. NPDC059994]|uniref:alpha/beta fold hydrolase n=1 Tax=Streptomyces sp. NPDC059994 TaxID=3347029 RepID=UPI0036B87993